MLPSRPAPCAPAAPGAVSPSCSCRSREGSDDHSAGAPARCAESPESVDAHAAAPHPGAPRSPASEQAAPARGPCARAHTLTSGDAGRPSVPVAHGARRRVRSSCGTGSCHLEGLRRRRQPRRLDVAPGECRSERRSVAGAQKRAAQLGEDLAAGEAGGAPPSARLRAQRAGQLADHAVLKSIGEQPKSQV